MQKSKVTMIRVRPETHKYLKVYMAECGRKSFDDLFSSELLPILKNRKRKKDYEGWW